MSDAPLLKDFVDRPTVAKIASAVGHVAPSFKETRFCDDVFADGWQAKALKERLRHVAHILRKHLDGDYDAALAVLQTAARSGEIESWGAWCLNDFVEEYGVDDPDLSLPALEQFTRLASSEFAVRPFIKRYPDRMAEQMQTWARNNDEAVRRLATEGYRPRLPWGMGIPALKNDPTPVLAVLELLHDDPSETVRLSVANNLNDISKDHPGVVLETLARWGAGSPEAEALRKHALRTLLKKGDPAALELLGFTTDADVTVTNLVIDPAEVRIGEHVYIEFQVVSTSDEAQPVMIDYAVTFQNKSGSGSRKVFKGKVDELAPAGSLGLHRKLSLQHMSTREVYPGAHVVEVQVNGVVRAVATFDVI